MEGAGRGGGELEKDPADRRIQQGERKKEGERERERERERESKLERERWKYILPG